VVELPRVYGKNPGHVSAVGEWITIRKKQVLVGENRVDWWVYDIHYSIVSDSATMICSSIGTWSLMLIAPGFGSWLEQE